MVPMPPPPYDHPPTIPVIEHVIPFLELQKTCQGARWNIRPGDVMFGCSRLIDNGTKCEVFLVKVDPGVYMVEKGKKKAYDATRFAGVRRHELAHCNGWPGDHPGANLAWPNARVSHKPLQSAIDYVIKHRAPASRDLVRNGISGASPILSGPR